MRARQEVVKRRAVGVADDDDDDGEEEEDWDLEMRKGSAALERCTAEV